MLQAMECGRGCWMRSIDHCVWVAGDELWCDQGAIRGEGMLLSVLWRNVMDEWRKVMHEKPKLSMMKLIVECEVKASCVFLKSKVERRRMLKLRSGTMAFQIEMGKVVWGEEGGEGVQGV